MYRWREHCNAMAMGGATEDCQRPVIVHLVLRANEAPGAVVPEDTVEDQVYWLCFTHWSSFINTMADNQVLVFTEKKADDHERTN